MLGNIAASGLDERVRMKAEQFEVHDPDKAMTRFQSLLGKLTRVTKHEVKAESKRRKVKRKRKR